MQDNLVLDECKVLASFSFFLNTYFFFTIYLLNTRYKNMFSPIFFLDGKNWRILIFLLEYKTYAPLCDLKLANLYI
jgi:hypothetical protein